MSQESRLLEAIEDADDHVTIVFKPTAVVPNIDISVAAQ